jgi:hypothetical protein
MVKPDQQLKTLDELTIRKKSILEQLKKPNLGRDQIHNLNWRLKKIDAKLIALENPIESSK